MNCFPSRLDLPLELLRKAILAGCAISFGSDAHARSHLLNLRFGEAAIRRLPPGRILNSLSYEQIKNWIRESRAKRRTLKTTCCRLFKRSFLSNQRHVHRVGNSRLMCSPPQNIPAGSRIVGIDLTAGDKPTGLAVLNDSSVETFPPSPTTRSSLHVATHRPKIVSIDSPLVFLGAAKQSTQRPALYESQSMILQASEFPHIPL